MGFIDIGFFKKNDMNGDANIRTKHPHGRGFLSLIIKDLDKFAQEKKYLKNSKLNSFKKLSYINCPLTATVNNRRC